MFIGYIFGSFDKCFIFTAFYLTYFLNNLLDSKSLEGSQTFLALCFTPEVRKMYGNKSKYSKLYCFIFKLMLKPFK